MIFGPDIVKNDSRKGLELILPPAFPKWFLPCWHRLMADWQVINMNWGKSCFQQIMLQYCPVHVLAKEFKGGLSVKFCTVENLVKMFCSHVKPVCQASLS